MRGCDIAWAERVEPVKSLLGCALDSAFAFVFGIKRMDAFCIRSDIRKAEQDLVEQVRAAFGKGNAEQNGQVRGLGSKTETLYAFFGLVQKGAKR